MNNRIRSDICNSLSQLTPDKFHSHETGKYISWLSNDITQIDQNCFEPLFTIITNVAACLFSFVALLWLHLSLAITAIIFSIILLLLPRAFHKKAAEKGKEQSQAQENFIDFTKNIFDGYNVFKTFQLMKTFVEQNKHASQTVENIVFSYKRFSSITEVVNRISSILSQFSVIFLSAYLSVIGKIPVGAVLSIGNIVGALYSGIAIITNCFIALRTTSPIFKKFEDIKLQIIDNSQKKDTIKILR